MQRHILLLVTFALACAEPQPATDATPAASDDVPAAVGGDRLTALPDGCDELADHILAVHPTRAALRQAFGDPDSTASRAVPNRHNPSVTDTLFDVFYRGLRVNIHTPGGGADLPVLVVVEDNQYLAYPRIGIGAHVDSVRAVLGAPGEDTGEMLVYNCEMAVDQPVRFDIADNHVRRITIEYYVD